MAAAGSSALDLECPVCREGFVEPKILPCCHLVCRKCLLAWLEKGGDQNGCPLCRAPILTGSDKGEDCDFASEVDALLTDLATAVVQESKTTLSGAHVCSCSEQATVFCQQCATKFCSSCAKSHAQIPATRGHVTEDLSTVTAEQLATHHQTLCEKHGDKPAELYCSDHGQLLCALCVPTHHQCSQLKAVGDVASAEREELKMNLQKLQSKEATVTAEIDHLSIQMLNGPSKFKAMRNKVTAVFDDLQSSLDNQRRHLMADIQSLENSYMAERKSFLLDLENLQTSLSASHSTAQRLASSASDSCFLGMLGKLKARLNNLENKALPEKPTSTPGTLLLSTDEVDRTKNVLAAVGMLKGDSSQGVGRDKCPLCECPCEGKAFAAVIKVGDRVRPGQDWSRISSFQPQSPGTVIEAPIPGRPARVRVLWDEGQTKSHRMGADLYKLKRVF